MIDVEELRHDVREFDVDVLKLVQLLEEAIPIYEADRVDLQTWRRRSANVKEVQSIADRMKVSLAAWQGLPENVREKIEHSRQSSVDAVLSSLIEDLELFAEIHREVKGNPGLASDNGAIEIGPLEWIIKEVAKLWPENRFNHDAIIIPADGYAEPKGRFLRFVHAVTKNSLDPQPSVPTLSAVIRKIKPALARQRATE